MSRFRRDDDYMNKVVSIHDPWLPGMGLGDVDDWAAIYYLAKRVTYPVIYIVSDVAVQEPTIAPGGAATRFDAFMALHAANLLAINANIRFVSIATWDEAMAHLETSQKIIICGRVTTRDQNLYDWLSNPANTANKRVYGSPAYNFGNFPLNVSPNPAFNLLPTQLVVPGMISYTSNSINRRVRRDQFNNLITVGPNGGPNNAIIDLMMMYGFMKNVCLPSSPGTIGFLVNAPGVGLGNSAYGIALYRGLDVQSGTPPAVLIQEYIAGKGEGAERGMANPWVARMLATPGIDAFIAGTGINTRPQDVQDMFFEATAVAIELFLEYVVVLPGQTAVDLLANGFPTLSTNYTFRLPPIPISSPMWDLFLVTCSLKDITPDQLTTRASLVGAPNSFPSPELLKLSGLDPVSVGGKTRRRKRTRRKGGNRFTKFIRRKTGYEFGSSSSKAAEEIFPLLDRKGVDEYRIGEMFTILSKYPGVNMTNVYKELERLGATKIQTSHIRALL
jgi:hypothetical protein